MSVVVPNVVIGVCDRVVATWSPSEQDGEGAAMSVAYDNDSDQQWGDGPAAFEPGQAPRSPGDRTPPQDNEIGRASCRERVCYAV